MRFKSFVILFVFLFAVTLISSYCFAQQDVKKEKEVETITCPISGNKYNKSEAVGPYNYKGTDYYFGCKGCLEKFKADPEKYLNKALDVCCGMTVDKKTEHKVTYKGKEYYFCCEKCKKTFEKDPEAAIEKMKAACKGKEHKCSKDKTKPSCSEKKSNSSGEK